MSKKTSIIKKAIPTLLTIILIMGMNVSAYQQNTSYERLSVDWMLMIYLCGDNAISTIQTQMLNTIKNTGASANVGIAVLIDNNGDSDTKLYYLDGTTLVQQPWPTESSMDDPATIVAFVNQVRTDYTANYESLHLSSNKGCGWQGVIWDDHGDGIMITMPELQQALSTLTTQGTNPLDILSIEACVTGNLEVAYQVKNYCTYYVALPECGLAGAWPYAGYITDLKNSPTMNPQQYAICMVNNFVPQYVPQYQLNTTMAAIDTSQLQTLGGYMTTLADYFITNLNDYKEDIETAQQNTRTYGALFNINYYIDPYHFLELLTIDDTAFITIKTQIITLIDTLTVAQLTMPGDDTHGFNFYFPRTKEDYNSSLRYDELPSPYEATAYAQDTTWDEFVIDYLRINDNTAPNTPTLSGKKIGKLNEAYELTITTTDPEEDNISYCIQWGDGSPDEWTGSHASGEEIIVNHTWTEGGRYSIQVKAKDTLGAESNWATLKILFNKPFTQISVYPRAFLAGKISYFEQEDDGSFRFLPINVLYIGYCKETGLTVSHLDESSGEYPCCGYIDKQNFRGIVTENMIFGIWKIIV